MINYVYLIDGNNALSHWNDYYWAGNWTWDVALEQALCICHNSIRRWWLLMCRLVSRLMRYKIRVRQDHWHSWRGRNSFLPLRSIYSAIQTPMQLTSVFLLSFLSSSLISHCRFVKSLSILFFFFNYVDCITIIIYHIIYYNTFGLYLGQLFFTCQKKTIFCQHFGFFKPKILTVGYSGQFFSVWGKKNIV